MSRSERHFEQFPPHSRHKQLIFKGYLEAWARKLLLRPGAGNRVCVVDACAGRGFDDAGNPGSPLLAARVAAEARAQLEQFFQREVQLDVIAIEKDAGRCRALAECMEPFGSTARVLEGTLADHIVDLARELGSTPTLYFIDPFGLEALKGEVIRRALGPERNEALLLFADQAALRHFGVAQSVETEAVRALRRHDEAPDLFEEHHAQTREQLSVKAWRSQTALQITKKRSVEILDDAFGDIEWRVAIENTQKGERRRKFLDLYRSFLHERCGARYTLPIPILNAEGDHVYFLLHAAKHPKAYRTMKEQVDYVLKNSPLPAAVISAMRGLLRSDITSIEQMVRQRLAGRTVSWIAEQGGAAGLKDMLLERTSLQSFELEDFQKRLRGLRQPGRKIRFRFPEQ